jgi:hypothetical protein
VTLNIRILGFLLFTEDHFSEVKRRIPTVLNHLEVDLRYISTNYASVAAIDDGAVALPFVHILGEPERRMQIGRVVNTEASVELG